jgi:hypothetical protein
MLVKLRATLASRWVRENAFTLFVMAPLVLGGAGAIFQPYLEAVGRAGTVVWDARYLGPAVVALLVARLSSAIRDVYALDGPEFYLDALPIGPLARLHDVLVVRIAKALPVALATLFGLYLAAPPGATLATVAAAAAPWLVVAAVALGVVETGAAIALVRLRLVTAPRLAVGAALAAGASFLAGAWALWIALAAVAIAYAIAAVGFARWRVEDRDAAREALARARRTGSGVERLADRVLGARVGAQVVRDLRLVRRGFSTAPFVAAGAALAVHAIAVWAGDRFGLGAEARAQTVEAAVVLSAFMLASVTHALVTYERERIWIDLTSGVPAEDFPRAKLWLGRLLAIPAFGLGCVSAAAAGVTLSPGELLELAVLAWMTATMTAVLCYELKERPAVGLVLAFLPAAGLALLVVLYPPFHILWYMAFFGYFYALFQLMERAKTKVEW